jgi:hypothetical protein
MGLKDPAAFIEFFVKGKLDHFSLELQTLSEEPRTLFFIRFLSLLNVITGGNYWLNSLYLSTLSFSGTWLIIKKLTDLNPQFLYPALISWAFFPTVIFWSSGILKESLAMLCFGVVIVIFLDILFLNKWNIWRVILLAVFIWVFWHLKYFVVALLGAASAAVAVSIIIQNRFKVARGEIICIFSFFILLLCAAMLHPNLHPTRILSVLFENHQQILAISRPGSTVPYFHTGSGYADFFINIPVFLFAGLFMPLPFQVKGLIALLPGVLNLFVLFLTMVLIYKKIKLPSGKSGIIVSGMLLYVLISSVLIAYSTPNFGTLERYKVSYLPVYLFLILAALPPGAFAMNRLAGRG